MLTRIFCDVDYFCKKIKAADTALVSSSDVKARVGRKCRMTRSDILTIIIYFYHSKRKTFKDYYNLDVKGYMRSAFNQLVSIRDL